ncbi:MAG: SH3 domain-containing protein [Butyrivibrio sp.]|nr:SH3 domain-containing protein [Acetatifactor muris]MCM1560702.1 SH3 domain-containing protein [Butyrivibrio sp.]
MRKAGKVQVRQGIWKGVLTLALVMLLGLLGDGFATVSHAQSQGRVTASSVNIRKEPSTSSEVLGSAVQGKEITINNQILGSDGKMWYQTFVNSETLGYIRSDFVEITDGTTPPTVTAVEPTNPSGGNTASEGTTPSGSVEALNPVSATVKGSDNVRIREDASTSSEIVRKVSNGLVVTVTGRSTDSIGKVWYQVSFSDNGTEVQGFIRSDYLTVSGELTPYVEEPAVTDPDPVEEPPVSDPVPVSSKSFETELDDGIWYLIDNEKDPITRYAIQEELFDKVENNAKAYEAEHKKAETEKVVIIILIFLLVAAVSGIAMLIFKIKDMSDDAYFNQVERETLRRRGEARTQGGSQKVMHTVGADKSGSGAGRPGGTRPAGASQGQKPAGARPAGSGQGQRPAGDRPAGSGQGQRPAGDRPAGSSQGQRPAGDKPAGSGQGQRPAGDRPAGSSQGQRPAGSGQGQSASGQKPGQGQQGWQSKNFMSEDDDEFEFGFLNYDGTEEK